MTEMRVERDRQRVAAVPLTRRAFVAILAGASISTLSLDPPPFRRTPPHPPPPDPADTAEALATWITTLDPQVVAMLEQWLAQQEARRIATAQLAAALAQMAEHQERLAAMAAWRARLTQARTDLEQEARAMMVIRFDPETNSWT